MTTASPTIPDTSEALPRRRGHRRRSRTRRRLLAAAIEVIAEDGEAFAVSDVTDRAGVSNGTFYNYFDDRTALLNAVVPEVLTSFTATSAVVIDQDDPAMQFAVVSATALRQAELYPDRIRAILRLNRAQRTILDGDVLAHLRADLQRG